MVRLANHLILAAALLLPMPGVCGGGPFNVCPRVEVKDGRPVLRGQFDVPEKHFLYADKLWFTVQGSTNGADFHVPQPTARLDPFTGAHRQVYLASFEATWPVHDRPLDGLVLTVHYRGCDEANCFFAEERVFRFRSSGAFTEIGPGRSPVAPETPDRWRQLFEHFTVAALSYDYLDESGFLKFLDQVQTGRPDEPTLAAAGSTWRISTRLLLILQGGLALSLALGAGLALPWRFARAGLSVLPKPGKWMGHVRCGFAVAMALLAGYYCC